MLPSHCCKNRSITRPRSFQQTEHYLILCIRETVQDMIHDITQFQTPRDPLLQKPVQLRQQQQTICLLFPDNGKNTVQRDTRPTSTKHLELHCSRKPSPNHPIHFPVDMSTTSPFTSPETSPSEKPPSRQNRIQNNPSPQKNRNGHSNVHRRTQ